MLLRGYPSNQTLAEASHHAHHFTSHACTSYVIRSTSYVMAFFVGIRVVRGLPGNATVKDKKITIRSVIIQLSSDERTHYKEGEMIGKCKGRALHAWVRIPSSSPNCGVVAEVRTGRHEPEGNTTPLYCLEREGGRRMLVTPL